MEEYKPQVSFLQTDINTRIRDLEERNKIIKERVLLLGKNLILTKENSDEEIADLKKQTKQIQKELETLKEIIQNILSETNKFVRREEIRIIERMLNDFQPLEFMRKKDVEELIKSETIKTIKTIK